MTNNKHVPKRRFKEFELEGEWRSFEFKELLDSYEGIRRGPFGSALKKEFFIPSSKYAVYEQNNAIYNTWHTRYFITFEKFKELEKFKVSPGDFLLSGAGTIGRISQVPSGVMQGVFNQALIRLRINKLCVDEKFFLIWMQSDRMQEKLTDANPGSAMTNLVPMSELKKWIVLIPNKDEQTKISNFIIKVNTLITLYQHKLDKLKNLKKSYLAELFPAEGERVPKRRFPGFEGEWEKKKLGEIMDVGSVKRVHQSDWRVNGVRFLRARDIVSEFKNEVSNDYLYIDEELYKAYTTISGKVEKGDVLVTGVGTIGVPLLIKSDKPLYFKDGNIIWFKNKNKIDGYFFYYSFIGNTIQKFIGDVAGIGTVGTYTIDSGKNTPILLPKSKEEQILIGNFLKTLDNSITLQQQKLDKLKDLKKAYLNELFV